MHSSIYFANQNCVLPTGSVLFSHHHSHFLDISNNRENSDSGVVQTIKGKKYTAPAPLPYSRDDVFTSECEPAVETKCKRE